MAKIKQVKRVAIQVGDKTSREIRIPEEISIADQRIRRFFVQQADSEFPDDDAIFPPTIFLGLNFDLLNVLCHWKDYSGTFECNLNIAGVDIPNTTFTSSDFSQSVVEAIEFDEPVPYKSPEEISIKVVEQTGVEQWEAVFLMRRVP